MKKNIILLLAFLCYYSSCSNLKEIDPKSITYATEQDFAADSEVSVDVSEEFTLELWAPGPLLANAVAVSFDNNGVAFVSQTNRRKSSDIDIRAHRDWMMGDLALQTIEETAAFHRKKLDPALSAENSWQEDFNEDGSHDWRDLEVQSERIQRVWDSDGDGRADASNLYANGFNSMLTGVAAGILHQDGEVFLTAAPDVYRLKDTDGDGVADQREVISHGYGIHIAYAGHDMSGLTMGPDGRVYWSIGDIGVNVVDQNGKRWAYPNQGAVMRANPDGSDFEVFAHGLRNPQELAFDSYGNLISVDNDGDHPGEHERFVHILEGSDSGWRINWQFGKYNQPNEDYKVWMDERLHVPHFKGQAAYLLPPLALAPDGPAGLAYNPGTALGEEWNDYFFGSYFKGSAAKSQTEAFKLEAKGASFEVVEQKKVLIGIASTGVSFGPDGALYINDWKDGYAKKPQGRIWKIDVKKEKQNQLRQNTQELLKAGMGGKSAETLSQLLAHADMRVRMEAQFELVKKGHRDALFAVAENQTNELARLHAIWGIGQLARKDQKQAAILLPLLLDSNENVKAQTAKVLGDAKYDLALDALLSIVKDPAPRAQFFAVEALGKLGNARAFNPLVELLEQIGDSDPHFRHGIMYALSKLSAEESLAGLTDHPSPEVRIGAVVALRHMASDKIIPFLHDVDPFVVTEAARAIHDDLSIPAALPALAKALERIDIKDEAFTRRAINANLRLGEEDCAQRLVDFANNKSADPAMRADALWALGYWEAPPLLDRVEGRYRKAQERKVAEANTVIAPHIKTFLQSNTPELSAAAARLVGRLGYENMDEELMTLLKNQNNKDFVRQAALSALAEMGSKNMMPALNIALASKQLELRKEAQTLMGKLDLPENNIIAMLAKVLDNGSIPEQQAALSSIANLTAPAAESLLSTWMDQLSKGSIVPELALDVLLAADKSSFESLKTKKAQYEANKPADDPLAQFKESMLGGNARRGGRIFYQNNSAQCIRCHQHDGLGGEVGPALNGIASELSTEELLAALVDPSARLAPGYGTVILDLKDGQKVVGILQAEDEEKLSVKDTGGGTKVIPLSDIAKRQNAPSGMLSMKEVLTKKEIRDLMAFLLSLK